MLQASINMSNMNIRVASTNGNQYFCLTFHMTISRNLFRNLHATVSMTSNTIAFLMKISKCTNSKQFGAHAYLYRDPKSRESQSIPPSARRQSPHLSQSPSLIHLGRENQRIFSLPRGHSVLNQNLNFRSWVPRAHAQTSIRPRPSNP